jgi:hypothetical protein
MPTRYGQLTLDQKQQIIKTFNEQILGSYRRG